jgi:hypothetical protein
MASTNQPGTMAEAAGTVNFDIRQSTRISLLYQGYGDLRHK